MLHKTYKSENKQLVIGQKRHQELFTRKTAIQSPI